MSLKNEPAFYENSHGDVLPTKAAGRLFRMMDAQRKELTDTMLVFENDKHSIKIVDESHGSITATVRALEKAEMLYTVKFAKKPRQGAIYTFRDAGRLSYLAFEPSKIVIDHRAEKARAFAQATTYPTDEAHPPAATGTAGTPDPALATTGLEHGLAPTAQTAPLVSAAASTTAPAASALALDDGFTPALLHRQALPIAAIVESQPVAANVSHDAEAEAEALHAVARAPAQSVSSVSQRTPIGQRHAPWRQR